MIQELYKKEYLKEYIPSLCQRYINFNVIEIRVYKYTGEKSYIKFYVKLLSCQYLKSRLIKLGTKNSTKNLPRQYLRWGRSLLLSTSINRGIKMPRIDKIDYVSESSSEQYEEIMNKLMELLIYLKQEVIYYEN